ncbi:MAG: hypothetical protein HPM95_10535 [Alphaproteobacteria bacterium]|nr:hypothetical protein [Alphaproteobacteria bacterium]
MVVGVNSLNETAFLDFTAGAAVALRPRRGGARLVIAAAAPLDATA